jgi:hypothetical protein
VRIIILPIDTPDVLFLSLVVDDVVTAIFQYISSLIKRPSFLFVLFHISTTATMARDTING